MPKIIINEFYRGSTLTTGDEFIELLLVEDATATQLNSFFIGDSTSSKAGKFSAYDFTNLQLIASVFKAGTIIALGGTTTFTQDPSYNPSDGDWNILLNAGGSFLPNANSGNTGDIAGDDVVWVDTTNTGATISADGFAVDIGTATGAFTNAANVNFGSGTNNTGYALNSDLAGVTNTANWATGLPFTSTTPGQANGGTNTSYIDSLRAGTPPSGTLILSVTPNSFLEGAGTTAATGTVTRTGDLTAPLTVTLESNDISEASVPNSITLAAGQASANFDIAAIEDAVVDGNQLVTLTASANGFNNATTTVIVTDNDIDPENTQIHDIQGAAHISPLTGQGVQNVPGIVTAIASNGFYIQDPTPDNDEATSEGIFIFTTNASILNARTVGEAVLVSGTVAEFRPGNNANNLTITQIVNNSSVQSLSVTPWTSAPSTIITPAVLDNGGRTIPTQIITNDAASGNVENAATLFDPAEDGIDFYESVEGMLVQINNPVTTSPTANFGTSEEVWVLADNGANATSRTANGGSLITANDFNPERIQIDDLINSAVILPTVDVGAELSTLTGVVNYDFNNYEVLVPAAPTVVQPSTLAREVTNLTGSATQLTVATFNVENLDPGDGAAKFNALATAIVNNLKSPDIINLEEIQDNNGPTNDSVVDASVTFQTLIDAIAAAGGPTYQYRQINPVDDRDGGEPGGNIRVGFLFNPGRVTFVDRPGGTSTSNTAVTDIGNDGIPDLSASPGRIDPTNDAFNSSRKPLVGEFIFNGQTVYVIGNHFNSKGGDQPLFGPNQPPTLTSEEQRNQQATLVKNFVESILAIDPNANIVVAGDLNDFEFSNPLSILESGGLTTLVETLAPEERYTYNFQGNAQVLDHILASNNLFTNLNGFDVVHINSEFADQISDHDPVIARFNLSVPNQAPTAVNFTNEVTTLAENTSTPNRIKVADITIADDGQGTNTLSLSGADTSFFELDGNMLFLKTNVNLNFEVKSSYAVTVAVDDATVGSTPDASANFLLTVTDVNEAPVAVADSASTTDLHSVTLNVLANDYDVDAGDSLSIKSFTNPMNGSLVKNEDNSFTYTPVVGFSGSDSFTYTVQDRAGLTDTANATVSLTVTLGSNSIVGTNNNDNLVGTGRIDVIQGLAGNDTFKGGLGADILKGGLGNDTYIVDVGDEIVEKANEGTDKVRSSLSWTLAANVENLILTGNAVVNGTGNELSNSLVGNNANNTLSGLADNDTLDGQGGIDTLIGGLGNDIYIVNTGDVIVENPDEGIDLVQSSFTGSLSDNVENLTLTGNAAINGTGNAFNNVITGNSADNTLNGDAGNDTLIGGNGSDTLLGGIGDDIYRVDSLSDVVTEQADEGTDSVQSSLSYTLGDFVEKLTLIGSSNINGTGNLLDNLLTGNNGRNTLMGDDNNDTLLGGNGNDTLVGGSGDDVLIGGNGSDNLTGDSGSDRFVYTAFNERTDLITDFNTSQDILDLAAVFDYLGSTPVTSSFLRFTQSGGNMLVQIDQNGEIGGANFSTVVTLNGVVADNLVINTNVLV